MKLRPYQQDCVDTILDRREAGVRRQLVSMATGLGKTVTFAALAQQMPVGSQMVMVAHREELIDQGAQKIAACNPGLSIATEMAGRKSDGREDVIVASIQTLGSKKGDRLLKIDPARVSWLVVDEAHHSTASTYVKVIDHIMVNPHTTLTGFTATPNRADGVAMGAVFDEIVYQFGMLDGIQQGWLSDVHGFQLKTGANLAGLSATEFKKDEALSKVVNTPARNEAIVRGWIEHCWPRQSVAFSVDVQHAKDLAAAFVRQGVRAAAVWGGDPERQSKLAALRRRELDVVVNAQLLIEGWDYWGIECVILAAPSKSQGRVVQQVGRGTRLDEMVGNLVEWRQRGLLTEEHKQNLLVMDCLDVFGRHSLVTLPSLFGLSPTLDMQGQSITAVMAAIKAAQKLYPNADLSSLESIDDLQSYAQSANMWSVRFAEEVQGFSELQWTKRGDGSYRILLPKNDGFRIDEDMVGKFSIEGKLMDKSYERHKLMSLSEAVTLVEKTITTEAPDCLYLLGREAKWMKKPVSPGQMKMLKMLKVPDSQVVMMNSGQAAALITSRINKRA